MPRSRKKPSSKSKSGPEPKAAEQPVEPKIRVPDLPVRATKASAAKPAPRKRGWRDIEAISERARLKKMLVDIWHEDIELDDDIFGDSDHLQGYYTDLEDDEIEVEIDDEIDDEPEEFDDETE